MYGIPTFERKNQENSVSDWLLPKSYDWLILPILEHANVPVHSWFSLFSWVINFDSSGQWLISDSSGHLNDLEMVIWYHLHRNIRLYILHILCNTYIETLCNRYIHVKAHRTIDNIHMVELLRHESYGHESYGHESYAHK